MGLVAHVLSQASCRKRWKIRDVHVSVRWMNMNGAPETQREFSDLSSPLSRAIGRSSAAHHSGKNTPLAIRKAQTARLSAIAHAMADADNADFRNVATANMIADQMVDDAALSLGLVHDRTARISLRAETLPRHMALADSLLLRPEIERAGFGDATGIARTEKAIGRAIRIRAAAIGREDESEALLIATIISTILTTCIARGVSVNEMDDSALMVLVEDASDLSLQNRDHE